MDWISRGGDVAVSIAVTDTKTPRSDNRFGAFLLFKAGGQGQGRTADLPLFRRTLVPTELPDPERS